MNSQADNLNNIVDILKQINYKSYLLENDINNLPYIKVNFQDSILDKKTKKWESVDPENLVEYPPEFDDLVRLHFLVRYRKVRIILEFGIGKSSSVFIDAIRKNKNEYGLFVEENLRISDPFKIYSVDNNQYWIDKVSNEIGDKEYLEPHYSECSMGEYNGKICTFYDHLPNIRPDFIYLDAPAQFGIKGNIRGISTNHKDRMPMAADILAFEFFLEPGTMIVVDGRTANARFLERNLQRNWEYAYDEEFDQHFFLLNEKPLGRWNEKAMAFTNELS